MSHITEQYELYYFHARLMLQKRSWAMDRWYAKENRREGNLLRCFSLRTIIIKSKVFVYKEYRDYTAKKEQGSDDLSNYRRVFRPK